MQTIEGFDDDPVMQELRTAFSREHALQCGFCTSGMLIAARDIVPRAAGRGTRRIRVELSGNLCRCTGYLGIINAVESVIAARGSKIAAVSSAAAARPATPFHAFVPTDQPAAPALTAPVSAPEEARAGWTRFEESFLVPRPPAAVWAMFADIPAVVACLDGAELTEHDANTAKGKMTVKLGPIQAGFSGSAVIERDDGAQRGIIRGAGSDKGTGSRTKGEIVYRLTPEAEGQQTRGSVTVEYNLQGSLAQFSRSGLVRELGRRLVSDLPPISSAACRSRGPCRDWRAVKRRTFHLGMVSLTDCAASSGAERYDGILMTRCHLGESSKFGEELLALQKIAAMLLKSFEATHDGMAKSRIHQ